MPIALKGWTWGHPRAILPLVAAAAAYNAEHPDVTVHWKVRSLQSFEHQPLAGLLSDNDLLVFDHPHLGAIIADGLLLPLENALVVVPGALNADRYAGPSLRSYQMLGHTWGAPIDGATIHALHRPDLLHALGASLPVNWSEAVELGYRLRHAGLTMLLAAQGHHGLLTIASLMCNLGQPWPQQAEALPDMDRAVLIEALSLFDAALDASDRDLSLASNAVAVHDALVKDAGFAYCPAAYGYALYGDAGQALGFSAFPGPGPVPYAGTVIGGAAVGVSSSTLYPDAAQEFVAYLASGQVQAGVIASNSGQPARIEGWDRPNNSYFTAVRSTIGTAWVRPRFAGYSLIERRMGEALEVGLLQGWVPAQIADTIRVAATGAGSLGC